MSTKKRSPQSGGARSLRQAAAQPDGKPSAADDVKPAASLGRDPSTAPGKTLKISTVSHTLERAVAERLRHFAFHERVSESAVIEYALREFFNTGEDAALGRRLREAGAALRRKS